MITALQDKKNSENQYQKIIKSAIKSLKKIARQKTSKVSSYLKLEKRLTPRDMKKDRAQILKPLLEVVYSSEFEDIAKIITYTPVAEKFWDGVYVKDANDVIRKTNEILNSAIQEYAIPAVKNANQYENFKEEFLDWVAKDNQVLIVKTSNKDGDKYHLFSKEDFLESNGNSPQEKTYNLLKENGIFDQKISGGLATLYGLGYKEGLNEFATAKMDYNGNLRSGVSKSFNL